MHVSHLLRQGFEASCWAGIDGIVPADDFHIMLDLKNPA